MIVWKSRKGENVLSKKIKVIICISLVLAWIICCFKFSQMDGQTSNSKSKSTINKALTTVAEFSNDLGVTDVNTESNKKYTIIDKINMPLRKCAHIGIYFVLGMILLTLLTNIEIESPIKYIVTIIIILMYATVDEYHQTFVPNRTGQISDVLIDLFGGVVACVFMRFFDDLKNRKKSKL